MKYLLTFACCVLSLISGRAQNVVPNSNFAIADSCPVHWGELVCARYWHTPNHASPDYFNACNSSLSVAHDSAGVPNNFIGFQASSVNAYAGIYTYVPNSPDYREYIEVTIPALTVGATYRVSVNVSLADRSYYATDGLGAFLYVNAKPDTMAITNIPVTPQVNYSSAGAITDVTNWTMLTGTFVADSAYTHLVIGNFKNDSSTHDTVVGGAFVVNVAYYYIDSVAVERLSNLSIANSGEDLCSVKVYPNPASALLHFDFPLSHVATIRIMDMAGRVMDEQILTNNKRANFNVRNYVPGLYIYTVIADNVAQSGKFIIQ